MKFLLFLDAVRDSTPPAPARLGARVAEACLSCLGNRFNEHEVELVNLLNHFGSFLLAYAPSAIVTYSAGQRGRSILTN